MAAPTQSEQTPAQRVAETAVLVVLAVAFVAVSLSLHWKGLREGAQRLETLGLIVAAGLTLIMYSFLYRDNPLFKVAENLYVGVSLGYGAVMDWYLSLKPEVVDPLVFAPSRDALLDALLHRTVPIILGVLLVTRLSRKHGWLSRYAYTLMVGWGAGIGIPIVVHTYILKQLGPSVQPLSGSVWDAVGGVVLLIGTVSVLFYFFFSVEHKGPGGAVSRVGIWFLMVSFGASFGYTVMGRVSLLIGRVVFLLRDWLQLNL